MVKNKKHRSHVVSELMGKKDERIKALTLAFFNWTDGMETHSKFR